MSSVKLIMQSIKKGRLIYPLPLFILVILSGCMSMPFSEGKYLEVTSSIDSYSFNETISDQGTVYHYKKSNQDGSSKADVWIYILSATHTESFKIYPFTKFQNKTDLVIADYDKNTFMANSIKAYLVSKNGERKLNASNCVINDTKLESKLGNKTTFYNVGHIPSYNYNFDWCDFSFMYRHLINKSSSFEVGVTVPDSNSKMIYAGKSQITYVNNIVLNNKNCRVYTITGEAFGNKEGNLIVDASSEIVQEINMPVRDNGFYKSFKFSLLDSNKMTIKEWDAFIMNKTKEIL